MFKSNQLPRLQYNHKPDDPYEKYIRANYMKKVIDNIEAQKDNLSKEEMINMLRQAVDNYTTSEGFIILKEENKPSKPKLVLIS